MDMGNKIREIRLANKMTQAQLAEKSGVSITSIKKYEKNIVMPKLEQLNRVADALGVSIGMFIRMENHMPASDGNAASPKSKTPPSYMENPRLQELFSDCTDKEVDCIIQMGVLLKQILRSRE